MAINTAQLNNNLSLGLHEALKENQYKYRENLESIFNEIIRKDPSSLVAKDKKGMTPLHRVLRYGNTNVNVFHRVIHYLLVKYQENQFPLCTKDHLGRTPLHLATQYFSSYPIAIYNIREVINALPKDKLVQYINMEDNLGLTCYDYALIFNNKLAIELFNNKEVITNIFKKESIDETLTTLERNCKRYSKKVKGKAESLMVNICTILDNCDMLDELNLKLILDFMGEIPCNVHNSDSVSKVLMDVIKKTPNDLINFNPEFPLLSQAIFLNSKECTEELLRRGAKIECPIYKMQPIEFAMKMSSFRVFQLLLDNGAKIPDVLPVENCKSVPIGLYITSLCNSADIAEIIFREKKLNPEEVMRYNVELDDASAFNILYLANTDWEKIKDPTLVEFSPLDMAKRSGNIASLLGLYKILEIVK